MVPADTPVCRVGGRPEEEGAVCPGRELSDSGWCWAGQRLVSYRNPLPSELSSLPGQPGGLSGGFMSRRVREGPKGVKAESRVGLWFSFHPNSLSPVGKPIHWHVLPCPQQDSSEAQAYLPSFHFYLKSLPFLRKGERCGPGPHGTDKAPPKEIGLLSPDQALVSSLQALHFQKVIPMVRTLGESSGQTQTP